MAGGLIADHQIDIVIRELRFLDRVRVQPEAFADKVDLAFVAGQKLPAIAVDLELLDIVVQHLDGIVLGVDGNRVEVHVLPDPIPEQIEHRAHARGLHRTNVGAAREDEVDGNHLAFDDVIEEPKLFSGVRRELEVGEVVAAPGLTGALCERRQHQCEGEHRRQNPLRRCPKYRFKSQSILLDLMLKA